MRVLLVGPRLTVLWSPLPFPPLGLMTVAANIRDKHEVMILDRRAEGQESMNNLEEAIKKFRPDMVGVTSLTGRGIVDGLAVSKVAKKHKLLVTWGGTHASLFPKQTLASKSIDFVVVGEGEITFKELLTALEKKRSLRGIKGLGYKVGGRNKFNKPREFIRNLDDYPVPAWDMVEVERYLFPFGKAKRKLEIVSSRGCPWRCTFCYNHQFNHGQWRARSAKKIIEEISFLKDKYYIDAVRFADDLFTVDKGRLKEFCELNKKITKISWDANGRINDVTAEFVKMMEKGGCARLTFGIECGSDRMQKFIKKDYTVQQCIDAFEILGKSNIMTAASLIIGLPTETREEVQATVELAKKLKVTHANFCPYVPFPGGELSDLCVRKGWVKYPKKIDGWKNFSFAQQKAGVFTQRELNRIVLYFQVRNLWKSFLRGDWGIIRNLFSKQMWPILKEMVAAFWARD